MTDKIKEMLNSPLQEMKDLGRILQEEEDLKKLLKLDVARKLLEHYPTLILGGSAAIYLHGIRLERWRKGVSDLDIIAPTYVNLESIEDLEIIFESWADSGSDFENVYSYQGTKIDFKTDPKQSYEIIEMDDFKWRVSKLETIWEAKLRYGMSGKQKHIDDLYEVMGKESFKMKIEKEQQKRQKEAEKRREEARRWTSS